MAEMGNREKCVNIEALGRGGGRGSETPKIMEPKKKMKMEYFFTAL
jgi:hypothetical protein